MAVAIKEDGTNVCFCILQLNHSESEGVCVNCLSSFNKLQVCVTRKETTIRSNKLRYISYDIEVIECTVDSFYFIV